MRQLLTALLIMFATFSSILAAPETDYPRSEERKIMLALLQEVNNRNTQVIVTESSQSTEAEKLFIDHFRDKLVPHWSTLQKYRAQYYILGVAVDRALYDDEAEKSSWEQQAQNAQVELQRLNSSDDYKQLIRSWASMAEGLAGPLPDYARAIVEMDNLSGFSEDQMPLLERLAELEKIISRSANESKVTGQDLAEYTKQTQQIETQYRGGEISFSEATRQLEEIWPKGFHAKGHDVATAAANELNEMAIIRTQLAQSKGYKNWAEYVLATAKFSHEKGYRTPDDHIYFMTQILERTFEAVKGYHQWVLNQHPQIDAEKVHSGNFFLLVPESHSIIAKYFPVENANQFWTQTMRESGFSEAAIATINLDSFPRTNKQTHAYMADVLNRDPKYVVVSELSVLLPTDDASYWDPAAIFIVQNARADGVDAYETVFHEGGHGLDFAHRRNGGLNIGESYAYTETASMTMERFFADRTFLEEKGLSREGQKPSADEVDRFLKNSLVQKAISSRGQVYNALFDILIWNEAYTEDGPKLVDRMREIALELDQKYFPGNKMPLPKGVHRGDRYFNTGHFYSGNVRYYGYIYADIAAQMTAEHLWALMNDSTGRATFYQQETLAQHLVDGQYKNGFSLPFPRSVEALTQQSFDPLEAQIRYIQGKVAEAIGTSDCSQALETKAIPIMPTKN